MSKYLNNKKNSGEKGSQELRKLQMNVYRQAGLAILTIVLTIVIIFAITSAWYTNIVQTSGLLFQAEAWGFDGEIIVDETPIVAAPGDSGLIHLQAENNSDNISAISFSVSKSAMNPEMQKRLFFYVDTQLSRNGETMDRVYLNEHESYTYTVFNKGWLTLTEDRHNDAQLKWQWVYDVLGYYVLAQRQTIEVEATETTPATKVEKMIIEEYLRPIEYDFDSATTTLVSDEDGILGVDLRTVDGVTEPDIYVWQISQNDGYPGVIDPLKKLSNGFYPVQVDSNGYGVYAYLCNYSEIELATKYDTELGALAYKASKGDTLSEEEQGKLSYKAVLTISAQQSESTVLNVNSLTALKNAVQQGNGDVIKLSRDITIPEGESLVIPKDARVLLDLNEKTIISQAISSTIKAEPGSKMTMINGAIQGQDLANSSALTTTGAEVVMSNVTISGFDYSVKLSDDSDGNLLDSRVHLIDCTVTGKTAAAYLCGNGTDSLQKTQLVIERSTITGEAYGVVANGTSTGTGKWGTDIQILDSIVSSSAEVVGAGIYHPQTESVLNVHNSEISGFTGIAIKGGAVSIVNTKVSGIGTVHTEPMEFSTSGFVDTADAVYIETNYEYEIVLDIKEDSIFTSEAEGSQSLRVFDEDATNVAIQIFSGTFEEEQPEKYIAEGSVQTVNGNEVKISVQEVVEEVSQ